MSGARLEELQALLSLLIKANDELSARNVVRRSDGMFRHASDITRHPARRALLVRFQEQQRALKDLARRLDSSAKPQLHARILALQQENALLTARQTLLVASLRGVLHALGATGGMRAWRSFFPSYSAAFKELVELDAVPTAEVVYPELRQD